MAETPRVDGVLRSLLVCLSLAFQSAFSAPFFYSKVTNMLYCMPEVWASGGSPTARPAGGGRSASGDGLSCSDHLRIVDSLNTKHE